MIGLAKPHRITDATNSHRKIQHPSELNEDIVLFSGMFCSGGGLIQERDTYAGIRRKRVRARSVCEFQGRFGKEKEDF
jgi:hypothetical protein